MAESDTEITREELQKEIAEILDKASLESTSTKKVIQKLESKLGVDLTEKKKLIDQLVMDYVNSMDSDEESEEEEPPKVVPKKTIKQENEDEEDDDINDDSNDSDWGYRHGGHLLDGYPEDGYHAVPQEPTVTTSETRNQAHNTPERVVVIKRKARTCHNEDETDTFGRLMAKKLRKLSNEQRDSMIVQISQLFYDKCHKRKNTPKRLNAQQMKDTAASTARVEAKRIYRLENTILAPDGPLAVALSNLHNIITTTYLANPDVPSSRLNKPIAITFKLPTPNNEQALANKSDTRSKCCIM